MTTSVYTDIDMNLKKTSQDDFNIYENIECINQSLLNIIFPKKTTYNRFQKPTIGTNIERLLGERGSNFVALQIKDEIAVAISNFEPRVKLISITSKMGPAQGSYLLDIYYEIKRLRIVEKLTTKLEIIL